jgi:hypothetical protein
MCEPSAKKTANFFINVAESHCLSNTGWSDSVASDGSTHHLPGLWALPLTTFSGHGTFSPPSKLRLAEQSSKDLRQYSFHGGTSDNNHFFFYFYCCDGMAVALLKIIS